MRLPLQILCSAVAAVHLEAQAAPIPLIPLPREVVRGARVPLMRGVAISHAGHAADAFAALDRAENFGERRVKAVIGAGAGATLQAATIRDCPAMKYRGFHDDLSRGPLPTLASQKSQIRRFAAHELNVYSPYDEHTLAYASAPLVAPPRGAMTRDEVRELVARAAGRPGNACRPRGSARSTCSS